MGDRTKNGKEAGKEDVERSLENSLGDDYAKSRKLWAEFRAGIITANQLSESLREFGDDTKSQEIKDMFKAKEI